VINTSWNKLFCSTVGDGELLGGYNCNRCSQVIVYLLDFGKKSSAPAITSITINEQLQKFNKTVIISVQAVLHEDCIFMHFNVETVNTLVFKF